MLDNVLGGRNSNNEANQDDANRASSIPEAAPNFFSLMPVKKKKWRVVIHYTFHHSFDALFKTVA